MTIELKFDLENENWINNVDNDFENLITTWIEDVKNTKLTSEDVLKVVEKIAKLRNDDNLIETIKQRMQEYN